MATAIPSDGVDGFRLDVAEMVPLGFWRDYRRFVRSINPEAYLVGEVWWEKWPDTIYDPIPWLKGDVFDAVMNYRWYMPTRSFFAKAPAPLTPTAYAAQPGLTGHRDRPHARQGDDEPDRRATTLRASARRSTIPAATSTTTRPARTPPTGSTGPTQRTRQTQEMILAQQFTYIGAPHIWNGDEVGMWGADDPDERKPMVWSDQRYEDEVVHPFGRPRRRDPVAPDTALFRVYRDLITLRKQNLRLFVDGTLNWLLTDDAPGPAGVRPGSGRPARHCGVQRLGCATGDLPRGGGKLSARLSGGRDSERCRREAQGPAAGSGG